MDAGPLTTSTVPVIAHSQPTSVGRAWFRSTLADFDVQGGLAQLGALASGSAQSPFANTSNRQINVWRAQLEYLLRELQVALHIDESAADWSVLIEYPIPRRQSRVDVVVLARGIVFVIEFKIGTDTFERSSLWQVEDYALDIRDFHEASRGLPVEAILVCSGVTEAPTVDDKASLPIHRVGCDGLGELLVDRAARHSQSPNIDAANWDRSSYRPAPTIIEAAQHLFASHSVENLSHHYADNLSATVQSIANTAHTALRDGRRTICFVTGVPGAGKTLAGLAAIHAAGSSREDRPRAAYMSGNGPLVVVLREALAIDSKHKYGSKREAHRHCKTLVQNVHEFLEEYGVRRPDLAPDERIIVFDEAQRAWSAEKLSKRHGELSASEPAVMLDIMSRHVGGSLLVALIGGGQEIHSGEAGLEEWGRALARSKRQWRVAASPDVLRGDESTAFHKLFEGVAPRNVEVTRDPTMHLSVSVRSPRARRIAQWVNAVLDRDSAAARAAIPEMAGYRLGLTRSLQGARSWLRDAGRDELRAGFLASSGNLRLRAYGFEMSPEFLSAYLLHHWFLADATDVRSSTALEVAMSEFKVQGLELDLVGMCWGDDLTISMSGDWSMRDFRGSSWRQIRDEQRRQYLLNKYRVLLTRARNGMVIWVPPGCPGDPTRDPELLDRTAQFLRSCGLEEF